MSRRVSKVELTLFPFLSVLAGLIAVLMLFLIVSVSTRVFAGMQSDTFGAGNQPADDGVDNETYAQIERQVEQLRRKLSERLAKQDRLARRQQELAALLDSKRQELGDAAPTRGGRSEGIRLGQSAPVVMVPQAGGGESVSQKPVFIEVSASGFVIHPEAKAIDATADENGSVTIPSDLANVLAEVHRRKGTHYIVFLVHPNGTAAFRSVISHIAAKHDGMNVGWEPFSREWVLAAGEAK